MIRVFLNSNDDFFWVSDSLCFGVYYYEEEMVLIIVDKKIVSDESNLFLLGINL